MSTSNFIFNLSLNIRKGEKKFVKIIANDDDRNNDNDEQRISIIVILSEWKLKTKKKLKIY